MKGTSSNKQGGGSNALTGASYDNYPSPTEGQGPANKSDSGRKMEDGSVHKVHGLSPTYDNHCEPGDNQLGATRSGGNEGSAKDRSGGKADMGKGGWSKVDSVR